MCMSSQGIRPKHPSLLFVRKRGGDTWETFCLSVLIKPEAYFLSDRPPPHTHLHPLTLKPSSVDSQPAHTLPRQSALQVLASFASASGPVSVTSNCAGVEEASASLR